VKSSSRDVVLCTLSELVVHHSSLNLPLTEHLVTFSDPVFRASPPRLPFPDARPIGNDCLHTHLRWYQRVYNPVPRSRSGNRPFRRCFGGLQNDRGEQQNCVVWLARNHLCRSGNRGPIVNPTIRNSTLNLKPLTLPKTLPARLR